MLFQQKQMNLLNVPSDYVIAHNIDAGEVAVGAGVALALSKAFPNLKNMCRKYKAEKGNVLGDVYRHVENGRTIYNMYTKPHVWNNSQKGMAEGEYLNNQRKCLEIVKENMIANGETKIAMPKIGCGLDKCNWTEMQALILEVFYGTEIEILICYI